jgi:hypothetical protein
MADFQRLKSLSVWSLLAALAACGPNESESGASHLPTWMREAPGSYANPIGAITIWRQCSRNPDALGYLDIRELGQELAEINPAFPPSTSRSETGYPAIVNPLARLHQALAGDAFSRLPGRETYESAADFEARREAVQLERNQALRGRIESKDYAFVLGYFEVTGMESIKLFDPRDRNSGSALYNRESNTVEPILISSIGHGSFLGRVESLPMGRINYSTGSVEYTSRADTLLVVENEQSVRSAPFPHMSLEDIGARHRGLAFVALGSITDVKARDGGALSNAELRLVANVIELRDLCSGETLLRHVISEPGEENGQQAETGGREG